MDLLQYFSTKLSTLRDQVYFVEIGAFTGKSTLYPIIRLCKWQGILVEPVPEYFDQLKKNFDGVKGLHFVNAAISDVKGKLPFYKIDPDSIKGQNLPGWAKKISSLSRQHLEAHDAFEPSVSKHITTTEVDVITLGDLLKQHKLPRIDVLQIDAEGQDLVILKQLDFSQYHPYIIHFEHARLTPHEQQEVIQLFLKHNYFIKTAHIKILAISPKLFNIG